MYIFLFMKILARILGLPQPGRRSASSKSLAQVGKATYATISQVLVGYNAQDAPTSGSFNELVCEGGGGGMLLLTIEMKMMAGRFMIVGTNVFGPKVPLSL